MEGFRTVVLSSGVKVDFTDDFVELLTLECLKYDILQHTLKSEPLDKKRQTILYAIGSALHLDISAAEMQEITQLVLREIYYKARRYANEDDGLCAAPAWLHEAAWRMRLLPAEHLPAPTEPACSGFQLSARAARALLRRLHQTLFILHDPVLGVIWQDVSEVSLQKLNVVLEAGDSLPQSRLLTEFEWRIVDLVLLYDDDLRHCVVSENSFKRVLQRAALETTCDAALAHRVDERVSRVELARRWSRAYQQYMSKGLRTSVVLLQRRWFELKRLAARRGEGAGGGGAEWSALLSRVAPHEALLSWPDLVRKRMVFTDQDLLEAEIEGLVPSQSPDCAPLNPPLENYGVTIEETPTVNVKVERDCCEQEWAAEEAREGVGDADLQPARGMKQERDTVDLKPIVGHRKSALFRFEFDEETEHGVISKQQSAPVAVFNDVTSRKSTVQGGIAKKLKTEREEDVGGYHEALDAGIDPKLLMDARVVVERCDFDAMLSKKPRVPPRQLSSIEEDSSVDSGDLWQPGSESEGEEGEEEEAEEARPVTLRDIDEVRRLTQLKLTAQVAPVPPPHNEGPTIDEPESVVAISNETPRVVVKVTDYCPLGLKSTRLRYGEGQSRRERQAAKRNHSTNQHSLTLSTKKSQAKKRRQEEPEPEPPESNNDLQEWLRQRNVNSRFFGPAPIASIEPVAARNNASLPAYADLIVRTLQSTQTLQQKKTNNNSSSSFTGFRKIAPATDLSSRASTAMSNVVSKVPSSNPKSYISMLVTPSDSSREVTPALFTESTPPLVENNSTVMSIVRGYQSSEPAQSSPSLLPKIKVINATASTIAASQHNTSTQLTLSMPNAVVHPGSTTLTTSAENQASISVPLPTPLPAVKSKKETIATTVLKFDPTVAKSHAPILTEVIKYSNQGMVTTSVKLSTASANLPTSNSTPVLTSAITTVTTVTSTAPNLTTSAGLSAPMSMVLLKPVKKLVDLAAANRASTSVQLLAPGPPLVPNSEEKTVNTVASYLNPTSTQSVPVPVLVLTPRDNALTIASVDSRSTVPQYPALLPISTNSTTATEALPCIPNAGTPGGSVSRKQSLLLHHNVTMTGTTTSPVINMLLTSPQLASWVMDQLTTNTKQPPMLVPRSDETKTSFCTEVTAVQNDEECTKEVHNADKNKQNDISANEQRKISDKPLKPHPRTASFIASPSLLKSQPGAQGSILWNNHRMSAIDYVNGLNHKKLKVICKKESDPFWIVANDYLVLTDNPRFVVKGKPAFYTLAPPEEIALLTFDLDGRESEPWNESAGGAEDAGGGAAVLAPNRMCVEGKLYQKMCNSPLRYAQVLGAVRDVASCRRLEARGQALLLYHARRHALAALRSVRHLLRVIGHHDSGENVIEIDVPEND